MNILRDNKELLESTKLFLKYLESQRFDCNCFMQILELNQGVETSVSKLLVGDNQFLLSTKVDYQELIDNNMYGAYGYLKEDGIYVPKTLEADSYFLGSNISKVPYIRHWYQYPNLRNDRCDYDAVVSKGLSQEDQFDLLINSNMSLFLGDVLDISEEDYEEKRKALVCKLYKLRSDNFNITINTDRDSKNNKEYVLMSRIRRY